MASDLTEPVVRAILESAEEHERGGREYISLPTPQVRALAQDWLDRRAPTDGRRLTGEQVRRLLARMDTWDPSSLPSLEGVPRVLLQDWLAQRAEIERLTERVRELEGMRHPTHGIAIRSDTGFCVQCGRGIDAPHTAACLFA